jgi:hypothetical protein
MEVRFVLFYSSNEIQYFLPNSFRGISSGMPEFFAKHL